MRSTPDPEAAKKKSNQLDLALLIVLLLVVGGVIFQVFLRYTYVHTVGESVVRIDRATGESCVMPCEDSGYGPKTVAYVPEATPVPAKLCHSANVVRVAKTLQPPPTRTPTPYALGGQHAAPKTHRHKPRRPLQYAVELSDGHVYAFGRDVFVADVATWTTGQDVQVCTTWSKLESRPYYSVGTTDDAEPAILAI